MWYRWDEREEGTKRKFESSAAGCLQTESCSCWDKYHECQFHYGKRLLWDRYIDVFSKSLHLNLPRLCFHTKWRPFPPPQSVPESSWAWQLEAEFAERWHRAWLGCSLDSCPDRRSAAQVSNRNLAKHYADFPIGLSDKILCILTCVLIFSIFIVCGSRAPDCPIELVKCFWIMHKIEYFIGFCKVLLDAPSSSVLKL